MKDPQQVELITNYSSIYSTEHQLNIRSKIFHNCLLITKITKIIYYKNLSLYGSFIEFLMDFCTYDDILDVIWITNKMLLHFKFSKSGQILHVHKTSFPRSSHKYIICKYLATVQVFSYYKNRNQH